MFVNSCKIETQKLHDLQWASDCQAELVWNESQWQDQTAIQPVFSSKSNGDR
jgi:hypothetical protein